MSYDYAYVMTANVSVENIQKKKKFDLEKFEDEVWNINADTLNEYFYYENEQKQYEI